MILTSGRIALPTTNIAASGYASARTSLGVPRVDFEWEIQRTAMKVLLYGWSGTPNVLHSIRLLYNDVAVSETDKTHAEMAALNTLPLSTIALELTQPLTVGPNDSLGLEVATNNQDTGVAASNIAYTWDFVVIGEQRGTLRNRGVIS